MNLNRGLFIAGNWKMNNGPLDTERFFLELAKQTRHMPNSVMNDRTRKVRACLFPPLISIPTALAAREKVPFRIEIGAQNVHWESKGAYTGEVSGSMLKEIGIDWALVGHSERRQYFGETNSTALRRAESLLKQGFHVVICIGESLDERKSGKAIQVITEQFMNSVPGDAEAYLQASNLIIAYEPVWAIGTGLTPTLEEIEECHHLIRQLISERWNPGTAEKSMLLYGGSVTSENIQSILSCESVDGALVGGASVKPESYLGLLTEAIALSTR